MTCKDCYHYEMCKKAYTAVDWLTTDNLDTEQEKYCKHFKDKSTIAEVVRCKDCKYSYESTRFGFNLRLCEKCDLGYENDLVSLPDEHFCSFGERRDPIGKE